MPIVSVDYTGKNNAGIQAEPFSNRRSEDVLPISIESCMKVK